MTLLLLVLFATSAAAQVYETMEVRVANVDVVVTDRRGNPVTGLTGDDFEVLENGFPRPITNFYEVRPDASGAPAPVALEDVPPDVRRRRIVIFVDQDSVDPARRASALEAAGRGLDKLMRTGDQAMVISFSPQRRSATEFTSDRDAVRRALSDALAQPSGAAARASSREFVIQSAVEIRAFALEKTPGPKPTIFEAYRISVNMADGYADQLFLAHKQLIRAVEKTAAALAGFDGKKVLILVGGDLQARPGAEVLEAVDALYRSTRVAVVSSTVGESRKRSVVNELDNLGRVANANGVTLYLINASDHELVKSAASAATMDTGRDQHSPHDTGLDLDAAVSMTSLARFTGGQALVSSINYDLLFDTVARDLGSYYSLGYKPAVGGGERKLLVKVKKPGLVARSRRSYTVKTTDEELNEQVVANAFYPRPQGELAVTIETGTARPDGENFELPVTIRIGELTTVPVDGEVAGEFAVYFVTASPTGNRSPVARDVRPFRYSAAEVAKVRGKPITYTATLRVRKGEQLVSVAVVDRLAGRSGFARAKFETVR